MSYSPSLVAEFSNQFELNSEQIVSLINNESGWQNKYRRIMLLGKALPAMAESLKTDQALVAGCESKVWLQHEWQDGILLLAASSDAKIVKGLIAIVLAAYQNKNQQQVLAFDIESYLNELGLLSQLSPSRGNGIRAIINTILSVAKQGADGS